jgi:hypothetical protein
MNTNETPNILAGLQRSDLLFAEVANEKIHNTVFSKQAACDWFYRMHHCAFIRELTPHTEEWCKARLRLELLRYSVGKIFHLRTFTGFDFWVCPRTEINA